MAWFDKKPKNPPVVSVIKYEGPNDVLIWRFPHEDFNTNSQLIVGPGQEAVFIKGGQIWGTLPSGTYTLDTGNVPFIRNLIGLVTRGVSPFSAVVYFVNKTVSMAALWGTDSPISMVDPIYGVPVEVIGNGDFALQVENCRMLLERLVGQTEGISHDEIADYFSGLMGMEIRSVISQILQERGVSCLGVDAMLPQIAAAASERIVPIFKPYGLALKHFTIKTLKSPNLKEFTDKSHTLQLRRMDDNYGFEVRRSEADTKRYEATVTGVTQQQRWAHEMGMQIVKNPGTVVNAVSGGVMPVVGVPGMVGVQGAPMQTINTKNTEASSAAGLEIAKMLLNQQPAVSTVPVAPAASAPTLAERVQSLEMMKQSGMVTPEEYEQIRQELLADIRKGGTQG